MLSNLPKVTELISHEAGIQTSGNFMQGSAFPTLYHNSLESTTKQFPDIQPHHTLKLSNIME